MLQETNQTESRNLEWTCQAEFPMDGPCDALASYRRISGSAVSQHLSFNSRRKMYLYFLVLNRHLGCGLG